MTFSFTALIFSTHSILLVKYYEASNHINRAYVDTCRFKALDFLLCDARILADAFHARAVHVDIDCCGVDFLWDSICDRLYDLGNLRTRVISYFQGYPEYSSAYYPK
jgi:hypothetical protein